MGRVGAAKDVNNFPGWPLPSSSVTPAQFCPRAPLVLGSCRTMDRVFSACKAEGSKELCVMTQSSKVAMCLIESLAHSDRRAIAHSSPINGQGRGSGYSARQHLACLVSLPHSSFLFKIHFQNGRFQKIIERLRFQHPVEGDLHSLLARVFSFRKSHKEESIVSGFIFSGGS